MNISTAAKFWNLYVGQHDLAKPGPVNSSRLGLSADPTKSTPFWAQNVTALPAMDHR
jgi:hypothetical protein